MSTRPVKLICTDFDGTIHDERCDPPIAREFEAVVGRLQEKGAKWVINTGRDLSSLIEEIARSGVGIRPDYVVVVEREIFVHRKSQFIAHQPWNERCEAVHARLFEQLAGEIPRLIDWVNEHYDAMVYEDQWSPFCLVAQHAGDAEGIVRYLENWAADWPELAVVRNDVYARLSHVSFDKGTALKEVARLCDSTPEETFAAGDHFNDVPMLRREIAHGLAAPSNARPEIKDLVRQEGGSVAEGRSANGVAEALNRWLGNVVELD